MKPLDIVKHNRTGSLGLITEVSYTDSFAVAWFDDETLPNAWFDSSEVTPVNNLARMLTTMAAHRMSGGHENPY